jgi:probable aminopeptidase NPEPL1
VSPIGFASSTKTLLKGAKTVAVIGPASVFKQRSLPKLLGKKLDGLLLELAKELEPGDLGASRRPVTSWSGSRVSKRAACGCASSSGGASAS